MKIAFTVCTNSFISFARIVGKSLLQHNSDYQFYIGLCDVPDPDLADLYKGFNVIPCADLGKKDDMDYMSLRYSVSDFKNALKAYFYEYLAKKFPDAEFILFLDPDVVVYNRLTALEELHHSADIVVTPHILHPQPFDGKTPTEISYLSTGTFNLGMISVKPSPNGIRFIEWWRDRLKDYSCLDWKKGLYYDQKWINLAPVFFEKVEVLRHPGYNVAYWNLHERDVTDNNGTLLINQQEPLVIYHFSNIDIRGSRLLTTQQNRFQDTDFPVVLRLYNQYMSDARAEGFEKSIVKRSHYAGIYEKHTREQLKKTLKGRLVLWAKDNIPPATRERWKKKLGL